MVLIISVEVSADGGSLILKDQTLLQDFIDSGIDIDNDIVSVTYTLTDSDAVDYTLVITESQYLNYVRDTNGFEITTDDLTYGSTYFADGTYTSTLDIVEDSSGGNVTQTGESDDMFLSQILQVMTSQIKNADWKDLYNPYYNTISSSLRKRMYYINIIYSVEAGLLDEAERIRLALNKLCSYDG